MADLLTGADAVVDEIFSYQKVNKLKNHYYGAVGPADATAGVIWVDSDDGKVYRFFGAAWVVIGGDFTLSVEVDNYNILVADIGSHLYMNNAASKTFSLPSVTSANVGLHYWLGSRGTGPVVIDAADSDVINTHWGSSAAGGNVTNSAVTWWLAYIELVTETNWMFMTLGGDGFALDP